LLRVDSLVKSLFFKNFQKKSKFHKKSAKKHEKSLFFSFFKNGVFEILGSKTSVVVAQNALWPGGGVDTLLDRWSF